MSELVENSIINNLIAIYPLLSKSFAKQMRKTTSIGIGPLYIIGLLFRNGIMSMSEISRRLSMSKPHVTAHVDRLIADGLAHRLYDEKDRRVINIELTPAGSEQFIRVRQNVSDDMRCHLQLLNDGQQEALLQATHTVHDYVYSVINSK